MAPTSAVPKPLVPRTIMGGGSAAIVGCTSAALAVMINAMSLAQQKRKLKRRQPDPLYLFQHVPRVSYPASLGRSCVRHVEHYDASRDIAMKASRVQRQADSLGRETCDSDAAFRCAQRQRGGACLCARSGMN